jgi:hypothetical protein
MIRSISGSSPKCRTSSFFLTDLLEDGETNTAHEEDPLNLPLDLQKMRRQETDELSWHSPSLGTFLRQETEQLWPSWGGNAFPVSIDLGAVDLEKTVDVVELDKTEAIEHGPMSGETNPGMDCLNMWMLPMLDQPEFAVHRDESDTSQEVDSSKGTHAPKGSPPADWNGISTVMLRNIPNKYTQSMLLEELKMSGFLGTYDFMYLPIDPETNANRGYVFINFTDPGYAWMLRTTYEGRKMCRFNSDKVVSVVPAALQGFEANYAHYSSSRVNRGDPSVRPLFLRESSVNAHVINNNNSNNNNNNKQDGSRRRGGRRGSASLIDMATRRQQRPAQPAMCNIAAAPPQASRPTLGGCQPVVNDETKGSNKTLRFCPFCGGKCKPEFRFCQFCGSALTMTGL